MEGQRQRKTIRTDGKIRPYRAENAPVSFSALYQDYARTVRSVIYRISGERDLDDLVQETFVKIFRALPSFSGDASLKTWVYRIATNVSLDHLRKEKRRFFQKHDELKDIPVASDDEKLANQDLIKKGLISLSADHRSVLVLNVFEEIPLKEAAEILEISEGTAKSRLFYAKKNMAAFLEENGANL